MIVVYVAGPFRGPTPWDIAENVRAAERVGLLIAQCGAMPLIPHANTAHFDGQCTGQFWLDGTMELLRRCDAVVLIDGWEGSVGATAEMGEANNLGIPTYAMESDGVHGCEALHEFIERVSLDSAKRAYAERAGATS